MLPKALDRDDIGYNYGDVMDCKPMKRADAEFLFKSVCRDEALVRLCATLITEYRKGPLGLAAPIEAIAKHLRSKGRLI